MYRDSGALGGLQGRRGVLGITETARVRETARGQCGRGLGWEQEQRDVVASLSSCRTRRPCREIYFLRTSYVMNAELSSCKVSRLQREDTVRCSGSVVYSPVYWNCTCGGRATRHARRMLQRRKRVLRVRTRTGACSGTLRVPSSPRLCSGPPSASPPPLPPAVSVSATRR